VIEIHGENGKIGEVSLKGGRVAGSTPAVRDVAGHMLRKHGSPQGAFRALATLNNGYVWAQVPGKNPAAAQQHAVTWDDHLRVIEMSAQTAQLERTPAPIGKPGGPGLYHVKGLGHADYFQQVRNGLMKRGVPEGRAHAMTWSILRRWAAGGGKVHPEVQAAARRALAEEAQASAKAHAHAVSWDDVSRDIELATVLEFFNPAQPRLPVGPGGGQFAPASGAQQGAGGQQQATGKTPPR
jgi:ADP-ribose pyrophosphatase YjhB (NUDIX family)